jgi:hypothetical protein
LPHPVPSPEVPPKSAQPGHSGHLPSGSGAAPPTQRGPQPVPCRDLFGSGPLSPAQTWPTHGPMLTNAGEKRSYGLGWRRLYSAAMLTECQVSPSALSARPMPGLPETIATTPPLNRSTCGPTVPITPDTSIVGVQLRPPVLEYARARAIPQGEVRAVYTSRPSSSSSSPPSPVGPSHGRCRHLDAFH